MEAMLRGLHFEVVQGDDYKAIDGRAVVITARGVCWPLNIAQVKLLVFEPETRSAPNEMMLDIDGTFTAGTTSNPPIASFDVARAETLKLEAGVRRYLVEIRALLASGSVATLARGLLTVLESQL